MNYKNVINGQIEDLQKKQKTLVGKPVEIEVYLKISKTIGELAVMASQLQKQKED